MDAICVGLKRSLCPAQRPMHPPVKPQGSRAEEAGVRSALGLLLATLPQSLVQARQLTAYKNGNKRAFSSACYIPVHTALVVD